MESSKEILEGKHREWASALTEYIHKDNKFKDALGGYVSRSDTDFGGKVLTYETLVELDSILTESQVAHEKMCRLLREYLELKKGLR